MIEQSENKLSPYNYTSDVHAPKETQNSRAIQNHKFMNKLMIACCIPMAIGGAIIFFSTPADQDLSARLFAVAPIAGCVVMHFIMHKFMGRTCHANTTKEEK